MRGRIADATGAVLTRVAGEGDRIGAAGVVEGAQGARLDLNRLSVSHRSPAAPTWDAPRAIG